MSYLQSRDQYDGQFFPRTEQPASRNEGTNLATIEAPELRISLALAGKCVNQDSYPETSIVSCQYSVGLLHRFSRWQAPRITITTGTKRERQINSNSNI